MRKEDKIVVIGAGVSGLTFAQQLASEGYRNIWVLDRHMPPVPDGSSNDISRIIRFDYADEEYCRLAHEAYQEWCKPDYRGIFYHSPFVLAHTKHTLGQSYVAHTTETLTKFGHHWERLPDADSVKSVYPTLSGSLAGPPFAGYHNKQAGWADAHKAISKLRDSCIQLGVSFICGHAGTVVGFAAHPDGTIKTANTLDGGSVTANRFVLAAGAWASSLVATYNSTLTTGQVLAYLRLSEEEMHKYRDLPIYINFTTGWFNFPPHEDTKLLKMAVHGWGYTRKPEKDEKAVVNADASTPRIFPVTRRPDFVPSDGEARLRQGLKEILPELANRPFDRLAMCWYTDTPTGDFIIDHHPDYKNLFMIGGGSGHLFKFLPILGRYSTKAFKGELEVGLANKWRFRKEYCDQEAVFKGDGSRGGPERRELDENERARL